MSVTFHEPPELPFWLAAELPWRRRMAHIDGVRLHFLDIGSGTPVLLMHGNPTWCYLWRKVIRRLEPSPVRLIVPDLLGLGLSDKPRDPKVHTLEHHIELITALLQGLELEDITLVGQDWGGPIAMGAGMRLEGRVHGVVLSNTTVLMPKAFRPTAFHRFSHMPVVSDLTFRLLGFPMPVLDRVQGDRSSIGRAEKRAYRWPLRHVADRTAPLALARMVPNGPEHPSVPELQRIDGWIRSFRGQAALVWGVRDPIMGRGLKKHGEALPQASVVETQAGHFLQEEVPDQLAAAILGVVGAG